MNVQAQLKLSQEEQALLAGILGCDLSNLSRTLQPIANAALEEYCRMILGQKVFTRTQDIKEYRMYLLVREVFKNRLPDDQSIADLFQTTPTESRSLMRSITSKYQYELRSAIMDTLREVVSSAEPDDDDPADHIITVNSSTKIEELNRILTAIDGTLPQVSKKRNTVSTFVIKASSYARLCEKLGIQPDEQR